MKKHLQFLLLIAAFLMPGLAKAQITATVADGTSTNGYVPVYGYYADAYLRAQIVYPESMMAELTGGEISQMTFHSSSSSISWGSANFEVKLGAATSSTLGSSWDAAPLTTVYTGSLSISASGEMTVTFSTPYTYTGGDLLVEVNETTIGSYVSCTWLGVSQNGASIQGYDYSSWSGISPSAQNFIPKTTFTYVPGNQSCPFPVSVVAENVTAHDASIHWTDTSSNNAWMLYYYPTAASENVDSVLLTDTSYYLAGLEEHTAYTVKVGAVCDTSNSVLRSAAFATPWGCPPVENLAVTYLSVDTAILVWKEAGVATSWVVEYDSVPFTPGAGTAMIEYASDTTITLAGLDTGGLYYVAVRPDCGGDDSILYTTTDFTTLAALPATVPFACDFEGEGTNGWDLYNGSQTNKWCVGGAVNNGGSQSLYISNNNGTSNNYGNSSTSYTYAKRTISLSEDGEYAYSFDWRGQGESGYYDYLRAFLVPTAEDYLTDGSCPGGSTYAFSTWNVPSTWHDLSGVTSSPYTLNQSSSWQTRVGTLQLTAGTYNLVFAWANDGGGGSNPAAAVDNVSLIRNTCPQVQNLVASYVSTDTVILTWNSGSTESSWIVSDGMNEYEIYDTTYTFDQLNPNTPYNFTVRAVCAADDTSMVSSIAVRTACGDLRVPFSEDFESYGTGTTAFPTCWFKKGSTADRPYINATTSYGHNNTHGLYFYAASGGYCYAILPHTNHAIDSLQVSFWARQYSTSYNCSFAVGVMSDPNDISTFVAVDTVHPNTTTYEQFEVPLSSYTGTGGYIAFSGIVNSGSYLYMMLDDVMVDYLPACPHVDNLVYNFTSDGVVVDWDEIGDAATWQVVASSSINNLNSLAAAYDNDPSIAIDVYEDSIVFDTMANGTTYYVFVRSDCGDGSYSSWVGPLSFTPGSVNIPTSGSHSVSGCGITLYDDGGINGTYAASCNTIFTLYPASSDSIIKLWGTYNTESGWDYLYIYDGATTSGNPIGGELSGTGTIDTIVSSTGPLTIKFTSDGSNQYDGFVLHTVCVPAPDCGHVEDLQSTTGPVSAIVSWTPSIIGDYQGATVEYREASDATADWLSVTTTTTTAAISGLTPVTTYDYRVQATCDNGEADWEYGTFTTVNYECAVIDTANSFSDTIGNGYTTNEYFPTYSFYDYALTQQIYTAADFDTAVAGTITAIGIQMSNISVTRNWEIYMTNTTATPSTLTSFIPVSENDLVWSGTTSGMTSGWNTINLASDFNYTGGNILVTFRDRTGTYSSGNEGYTHSISGNSLYVYQDGTDFDPTNPPSYPEYEYERLNMFFNFQSCLELETCPAPIVTVAGNTTSSIDLTWVPGGEENSWNVYHRVLGDTTWTLDGVSATTNYTISGLYASTDYEIMVQSICGTDEGGAAVIVASSSCGLAPVPYTEDMESHPYGEFERNCWGTGTTNLGTSYPYPYVVSLTGDENNKLCLIYNGGYMILPEFDAPLNTLQARFTLVQGGDNVRLIMGLIDDINSPITTIRPLDTLIRSEYVASPISTINLVHRFDDLDDSVTGHIVFWDAFNDNYNFIDNLVIEEIPSCATVTNVAVSNVGTNSADLSWEDDINSGVSYLVEYGHRGFALGTGTVVPASVSPYSLTGLDASTSYEAYIYTICNNDTSMVSNMVRFATECDAVTLPYVMNFDNEADAGSTRSPLPPCWSFTMLDASYSSSTYEPCTYNEASYASSGSYCLWLYGTTVTALPEMPTTVDSLMISFHEYNTSSSSYKLIVGAVDSVTPGFEASFVGIDTINVTGTSMNVLSFLSDYTGTGRYIAFKTYNTSGYGYSYHYIDDIVVDYIPSCVYPVNLRTTSVTGVSADITWSVCQAEDYEFEYGPTGFTRGTGIFDTCSGRMASISGLNYGTTYDIYVRGICAVVDTSEWSSCFTFSTLNADPVSSYPYICPFTDTTLTNCGWEVVNGSQANKWYVGTAAYYGTADNMGLYISNDNGVSNNYTNTSSQMTYAYRALSMNAGSYNIGFNWQAYGESNYDYLRAWLVPGVPNVTAGQLPDGSTSTYNYTSSTPAGWISLDGGEKLNYQSTWQSQSTDVTISANGTYSIVFMWANDGSGGTTPPAAIDNVEVFLNTCPAPDNIYATAIGTTSMTIDWVDINPTVSWQFEYGESGFTRGSGTMMNVTSHPVTLTGLDSLTSYDVYVRPICSNEDTGRWSNAASFSTTICDNAAVATNSTVCNQSTSYFPGYSTYCYSYTEVIIDSADLVGSTDISAFQFKPQSVASGSSYMNNCTIYLANTNQTDLSSGFIQDTATFVPVFTGSLNFSTTDWQTVMFDTTFTWDGHSNIVVAVNRQHGSWSSGGYFDAYSTSTVKARYIYTDGSAYIVGSISGGTTTTSAPIYRLISCGGASCGTPVITGETHDYQSVTVTWNGTGNNYEVAIKETAAGTWPDAIAVTGNTYTFTGLNPSTSYSFRVRQDCNADSLGYSDWANGGVVTDSLPCFAPDSLHAIEATNATATLDWNTIGNETNWDIHVWAAGFDSIYRVNAHPATVGGFTAGVTYNATVRALCGVNLLEGDWSDATQFTTATCPDVTGLTTSDVTAHSVKLSWTADPMAESWKIEYGYRGTPQGQGTVVTVNTNTYTVTGLSDETSYQFYVQAVCGTGWESEQWAEVFATTAASSGDECNPVSNLTVSDITTNSAMVTWFSESGSAWNVVVPEANVDDIVYDQQYALTGLLANTNYNVKVRTVCDNDQYSDFVTTSFMTEQEEGIDGVETMNCTIYPNPTSSATTISVSGVNGKVKIAIVDMNGRTVASETLECASDCVKTMDVENLAQGAYFVRITGDNVNMVKKLVVR